jgi:hypothetical protein
MQSSEPSRTGNLGNSNGQPADGIDAMVFERDRLADERDREADARDERADERDLAAAQTERTADPIELRLESERTLIGTWARERALAASNRERAAHDRSEAASDRRRSAEDRGNAAQDRDQASRDLVAQETDELTGARRRDPGLAELAREAERSRRTGEPLSIAFVDVDGLKTVPATWQATLC